VSLRPQTALDGECSAPCSCSLGFLRIRLFCSLRSCEWRVERLQRDVARVVLRDRRLHGCRVLVAFKPCSRLTVACCWCCRVSVYSVPACRRVKAALEGAARRAASGHGDSSRTQAQAISCLVVVSCCRRSLWKKAPASWSSVPFTHAMVDGVAATSRPTTNATEHACKAQFLLSPMLHVEVVHEDLNHDEALLAMLCFAWTCNHYMPSSSAQIPRVRNMYTKVQHPLKVQSLPSTMLHVGTKHEHLLQTVIMLAKLCCASIHIPMPYIPSSRSPNTTRVNCMHIPGRHSSKQKGLQRSFLLQYLRKRRQLMEKKVKCMPLGEPPSCHGKGERTGQEARKGNTQRC
jgi:hypothetical protein